MSQTAASDLNNVISDTGNVLQLTCPTRLKVYWPAWLQYTDYITFYRCSLLTMLQAKAAPLIVRCA